MEGSSQGAAARPRSSTPVNVVEDGVAEEMLLDGDNADISVSDISEVSAAESASEVWQYIPDCYSESDVDLTELTDYGCAMSCPCSCCENGNCRGCPNCLCQSLNYSYDLSFLQESWDVLFAAAAAASVSDDAAAISPISGATSGAATSSTAAASSTSGATSATSVAAPSSATMVWLSRQSYDEVVGNAHEREE